MNTFKKGGFKGGNPKFNGKKKFGGNNKPDSVKRGGNATGLFSASCSECGKKCDVPFRPSPDKPVYCSECFGMKKSANESRGSHKSNRTENFTQSHKSGADAGKIDNSILELKRQITSVELKLNRILDIINPPLPSTKVPTPTPESKTPKKAAQVAKKPAAKKAAVKKAVPKKAVAKKAVKKTTSKKK